MKLPTRPIELNLLELGWMTMAVWTDAKNGNPMARSLYLQIKAASISLGVQWYYGDPWPEAETDAREVVS